MSQIIHTNRNTQPNINIPPKPNVTIPPQKDGPIPTSVIEKLPDQKKLIATTDERYPSLNTRVVQNQPTRHLPVVTHITHITNNIVCPTEECVKKCPTPNVHADKKVADPNKKVTNTNRAPMDRFNQHHEHLKQRREKWFNSAGNWFTNLASKIKHTYNKLDDAVSNKINKGLESFGEGARDAANRQALYNENSAKNFNNKFNITLNTLGDKLKAMGGSPATPPCK